MNPNVWEWIKTLLPLIGAVGVVFLGAWLTRSRERKHWLNDCRKEEYRELINTLTLATMEIIRQHDPSYPKIDYLRPEKMWDAQDFYMKSLAVIRDRIFISDEIRDMKVYDRWTNAMQALAKSGDHRQFEEIADDIHLGLVERAKKPV
jgi:hypothetical protein